MAHMKDVIIGGPNTLELRGNSQLSQRGSFDLSTDQKYKILNKVRQEQLKKQILEQQLIPPHEVSSKAEDISSVINMYHLKNDKYKLGELKSNLSKIDNSFIVSSKKMIKKREQQEESIDRLAMEQNVFQQFNNTVRSQMKDNDREKLSDLKFLDCRDSIFTTLDRENRSFIETNY